MQYQRMSSSNINFRFESKNFFSIFGLYLFSLGAGISGYSLYLLLEVIEEAKGPSMSIDDKEYRWVSDRIEYWNAEERTLTSEEIEITFIVPYPMHNVIVAHQQDHNEKIFDDNTVPVVVSYQRVSYSSYPLEYQA